MTEELDKDEYIKVVEAERAKASRLLDIAETYIISLKREKKALLNTISELMKNNA